MAERKDMRLENISCSHYLYLTNHCRDCWEHIISEKLFQLTCHCLSPQLPPQAPSEVAAFHKTNSSITPHWISQPLPHSTHSYASTVIPPFLSPTSHSHLISSPSLLPMNQISISSSQHQATSVLLPSGCTTTEPQLQYYTWIFILSHIYQLHKNIFTYFS